MSLLPVLLVYATQWLAGGLLLAALDGGTPRRRSSVAARALLLGPCALAVQLLMYDACGIRFALPALLLPWWIVGGCVLLARWRRRARVLSPATPPGVARTAAAPRESRPSASRPPGTAPAAAPADAGRWRRAAQGLAAVLFLLALGIGLLQPVYDTDAMNNFALLARVYATSGSLAPQAVASLAMPGHIDYPPLIPLNEAAIFLATQGDPGLAIKPFFALAYLALLLLVIEACFLALPERAAALAAAFTMLLPLPAHAALEGYADVFLTASLLLQALQGGELLRRPTPRAALLYALCVASCALTKFEGLAIALPAALLPLVVARRAARRAVAADGSSPELSPARPPPPLHAVRNRLRPGAAVSATLLALAISLAWPLHLALHQLGSPPLLADAWHDLPRALARWPEVAQRLLGTTWLRDPSGHLAWGLFWQACAVAALLGLLRPQTRPAVLALCLILAAHLALYAAVLALSPSDLQWHANTAGPRLLLHTLPWALLAGLAALAGLRRPSSRD